MAQDSQKYIFSKKMVLKNIFLKFRQLILKKYTLSLFKLVRIFQKMFFKIYHKMILENFSYDILNDILGK